MLSEREALPFNIPNKPWLNVDTVEYTEKFATVLGKQFGR